MCRSQPFILTTLSARVIEEAQCAMKEMKINPQIHLTRVAVAKHSDPRVNDTYAWATRLERGAHVFSKGGHTTPFTGFEVFLESQHGSWTIRSGSPLTDNDATVFCLSGRVDERESLQLPKQTGWCQWRNSMIFSLLLHLRWLFDFHSKTKCSCQHSSARVHNVLEEETMGSWAMQPSKFFEIPKVMMHLIVRAVRNRQQTPYVFLIPPMILVPVRGSRKLRHRTVWGKHSNGWKTNKGNL